MKRCVLYVHGKGGNAIEADHYKPLFKGCTVIGVDYRAETPWEAGAEIYAAVKQAKEDYDVVCLIANSIGAYYSMNAGIDRLIEKAYFISPILDMERLIEGMMSAEGVSELELERKRRIPTSFGEDLMWDYLCYVRKHPIRWTVSTEILYGSEDLFTGINTVKDFARSHHARLTVMSGGEHWFHTKKQMDFLDQWINDCEKE